MAQSSPDAVEEHIHDQDVLLPDSAGAGEAESAFSASQALEQLGPCSICLRTWQECVLMNVCDGLSHCLQKT